MSHRRKVTEPSRPAQPPLQNPLATTVSLAIRNGVPRKSKAEQDKQADAARLGNDSGSGASVSTTPAVSSRPKRKKAPLKKTTPKPAKASRPAKLSVVPEPSDEEIRLRAYFIAERRSQFSLPGSSDDDWIEARRQLLEEASGPQS
jgi:hypothetical protein